MITGLIANNFFFNVSTAIQLSLSAPSYRVTNRIPKTSAKLLVPF